MKAPSVGRRFVDSAAYQAARARGDFKRHDRAALALVDGVDLLSGAELRAALSLRTYSDIGLFDVDGVPEANALPAYAGIPALVETIPVDNIEVYLAAESSEVIAAAAVADGQPLPEDSENWGGLGSPLKLPRVGSVQPVSLGVLDSPGRIASLLDRRMRLGFTLGLENEILNGNGFWPGLIGQIPAGNTIAKGGAFRVDAILDAGAAVAAAGWYLNPMFVISHPTTRAVTFKERDATGRPLPVSDMLLESEIFDSWLVSKYCPIGIAVVADLFQAVALLIHGGLGAATSTEHTDFFTRGLAALSLHTRAYSWVRSATAAGQATGL